LILMFTAGPLIFPRLYSIHEYYFVAAGVFLTAGLGMAVARIGRESRSLTGVIVIGVTAGVTWAWAAFCATRRIRMMFWWYWGTIGRRCSPMPPGVGR